jgi:hypothetical protein
MSFTLVVFICTSLTFGCQVRPIMSFKTESQCNLAALTYAEGIIKDLDPERKDGTEVRAICFR